MKLKTYIKLVLAMMLVMSAAGQVGSNPGSNTGINQDGNDTYRGVVTIRPVYHNGTAWVDAQSDVEAREAEMVELLDAGGNLIARISEGVVTLSAAHGLAEGSELWLSQTVAGAYGVVRPASGRIQDLGTVMAGSVIDIHLDESFDPAAMLASPLNLANGSAAADGDDVAVNYPGYFGLGQPNPDTWLHFGNLFSDAGGNTDFSAAAPDADGFDQFSEYKTLYYEGASSQASYGTGIENGSLVDNVGPANSNGWRAFRFGGEPRFGIRGDGYVRQFLYGDGTFNNGTPTSVIGIDALGWHRERPISDGAPRIQQPLYGGGWLWGGWSPVYTANTGYVDEGWVTAFTATAPQLPAGYTGPARTWDMQINANFGQKLNYQRECITREIYGWRVLINGTVVGTRATAIVHYQDELTNLGNETINKLIYKPIGDWHWTRNAVPAGATVVIQYQHRHQVVGAQTNAYARFISGVHREANITFLSAKGVAW